MFEGRTHPALTACSHGALHGGRPSVQSPPGGPRGSLRDWLFLEPLSCRRNSTPVSAPAPVLSPARHSQV